MKKLFNELTNEEFCKGVVRGHSLELRVYPNHETIFKTKDIKVGDIVSKCLEYEFVGNFTGDDKSLVFKETTMNLVVSDVHSNSNYSGVGVTQGSKIISCEAFKQIISSMTNSHIYEHCISLGYDDYEKNSHLYLNEESEFVELEIKSNSSVFSLSYDRIKNNFTIFLKENGVYSNEFCSIDDFDLIKKEDKVALALGNLMLEGKIKSYQMIENGYIVNNCFFSNLKEVLSSFEDGK